MIIVHDKILIPLPPAFMVILHASSWLGEERKINMNQSELQTTLHLRAMCREVLPLQMSFGHTSGLAFLWSLGSNFPPGVCK